MKQPDIGLKVAELRQEKGLTAVLHLSSTILFVIVTLLSGCTRANEGDIEDLVDTAQATETPTPTSAAVSSVDGGSAVLHYTYEIESEFLNVHTDERFYLRIWVDNESEALVTGEGTGIQVVELAGMNKGVICWITIQQTALYEIRGVFMPETCSFEINVLATDQSTEVVSDECGAGIDPKLFFYPPPPGPHVFTEDLEPVVLNLDQGVEARFELDDVQIPANTGCQW
ncbi:MAG: hypothetical protein ISS57_14025 [Anaerolineales bacterium]|nr:hypothetical protein [Anaerolineales bacterium]